MNSVNSRFSNEKRNTGEFKGYSSVQNCHLKGMGTDNKGWKLLFSKKRNISRKVDENWRVLLRQSLRRDVYSRISLMAVDDSWRNIYWVPSAARPSSPADLRTWACILRQSSCGKSDTTSWYCAFRGNRWDGRGSRIRAPYTCSSPWPCSSARRSYHSRWKPYRYPTGRCWYLQTTITSMSFILCRGELFKPPLRHPTGWATSPRCPPSP